MRRRRRICLKYWNSLSQKAGSSSLVIITYDIIVIHFYSDCSQVLRELMLYVLAALLYLLLWPSIWVGFSADPVISNQLVCSMFQIGQASEHSLKLFHRLKNLHKKTFSTQTSSYHQGPLCLIAQFHICCHPRKILLTLQTWEHCVGCLVFVGIYTSG